MELITFQFVWYNCFHFHCNNLFAKCQSSFIPDDSFLSRLLSTVHEIQLLFGFNPPIDVRAVFLDVSKAFNKMWHQGSLLIL